MVVAALPYGRPFSCREQDERTEHLLEGVAMAHARVQAAAHDVAFMAGRIAGTLSRTWRKIVNEPSDTASPTIASDSGGVGRVIAPVAGSSEAGSDGWACERLQAIGRNADKQAFAELFAWYAPRIKAFVMRGGASPDTAQEVAQEAMISVWRRAATFDPTIARPATWIYSIARNRRIDMVRRDRRSDAAIEDLKPLQEEVGQADTAIVALESGDRVREAIEQLAPEQLEVIRKAFFEDKSHSQIAVELGLPLGTVKSRIRHALLRLRARMQEDGR
jgi:RNA polymerase sigma-70 factor (ECF subfamily)